MIAHSLMGREKRYLFQRLDLGFFHEATEIGGGNPPPRSPPTGAASAISGF